VSGTIAPILHDHRARTVSPLETIANCYDAISAFGDKALFITVRDRAEALSEARALADRNAEELPLFGIPFVVKDNIDVKGLPTTAACPAFSYEPKEDATAVRRLREAGAIVIGKTNLDQFATGLVGVRSPYGIPRNALREDLIPGGSSAGSATAVAAGLVPFSLGTDTAGSGRVPAMLNNIVGLKPSLGLLSTSGVVPACRSLDCVSIFALTVDDAWTVLNVAAGYDEKDPYSRCFTPDNLGSVPTGLRVGVPAPAAREFFGDREAKSGYDAALDNLAALGLTLEEIDFQPFYETARLLYEGPWVAERYLVVRELLQKSPDALHPVTREIVAGGGRPTAADAFAAFYRLEDLRRISETVFRRIDAMVVPTAPTTYTRAQVLADPIRLNSRLGTYTNFVNLLNLCGIAVPTALSADKTPFGVTLLAPAGRDGLTASIGRALHAASDLPLGATNLRHPPLIAAPAVKLDGHVEIAVFGAHLSGLELNREMVALGARLIRPVRTAPNYRLYLLPSGPPQRPGLVRVEPGKGASIEAEIWAMPAESLGRLVAAIPSPLGIGTIELSDGASVKGFLAESAGADGARDITNFGGWRSFLAAEKGGAQTVSA
jgi:allophanate hydrolase